MECREVYVTRHAFRRMWERGVGPASVRGVVRFGEVIEEYPDDEPFPSVLVLGNVGTGPIHVVAGVEQGGARCHIITVYFPDPDVWDEFRTRRR